MVVFFYILLLSFFVIFICSDVRLSFFSDRDRALRFSLKLLIKSYIKQFRANKIFFVDIFKYLTLLSSACIVLQFQFLSAMNYFSELNPLTLPVLFVIYIISKIAYSFESLTDSEHYFYFTSKLEEFFLDMVLIGIMTFWLLNKVNYIEPLLGLCFLIILIFRVDSFWHKVNREERYKISDTVFVDDSVASFGEYIYILALFFFFVNYFIASKFIFGIKLAIFIFFYKFIIFSIDRLSGWLVKRKEWDRKTFKFKYVLFPIFLVILIMQV